MIEQINSGSNYDSFNRAKPVGTTDVQVERQAVTEKPEEKTSKKTADTVSLSTAAVDALVNAVSKNAPEAAREKSMQESQGVFTKGSTNKNPLEALAQSYGVGSR